MFSEKLIEKINLEHMGHSEAPYQIIDTFYCPAGEITKCKDNTWKVDIGFKIDSAPTFEKAIELAQSLLKKCCCSDIYDLLPLDESEGNKPEVKQILKAPSSGKSGGIKKLSKGESSIREDLRAAAIQSPNQRMQKRRLDRELMGNPPQFSDMKNLSIPNLYVSYDQNGKQTNRWRSRQVMTYLNRFSQKLNVIREIVNNRNTGGFDFDTIEEYANDFYEAWGLSSSDIFMTLGSDETLEILRLLRLVYFIAWEDEGELLMQYCGGPLGTLTVYRGEICVWENDGNCNGISWTLDRATAEFYANGPGGVLYKGTVSCEEVLLFLQDEWEVVVNPGSVQAVEVLQHFGVRKHADS